MDAAKSVGMTYLQAMRRVILPQAMRVMIPPTGNEFIAMLNATDGQSYFARIGQELFDGALIAMDEATATFRQDVEDRLSPVRTREVVKSLYPSEEAR